MPLAIQGFVSGITGLHYQIDATVEKDSERQAWVAEIFTEGFMGRKSSGVPSTLQTRAELIKFLAMINYWSLAQHAAVNSRQQLGSGPIDSNGETPIDTGWDLSPDAH
ncbi:unnamed protein product [Caretta caretta]